MNGFEEWVTEACYDVIGDERDSMEDAFTAGRNQGLKEAAENKKGIPEDDIENEVRRLLVLFRDATRTVLADAELSMIITPEQTVQLSIEFDKLHTRALSFLSKKHPTTTRVDRPQ